MKKKIAVLGGGMGAMTAVYELLRTDNFENNYDITVYQMGWRIGGKGASGRNPDIAQRIEEHGLHMWFGMYNNAFNLIKDCYERLGRQPGTPLATWKDAFKPHHRLVATEWYSDTAVGSSGAKWHWSAVSLPTNGEEPGGDHEFLPIEDYIEMLLEMIFHHFKASDFYKNHPSRKKGCLGPLFGKAEQAEIEWAEQEFAKLIRHFSAHKETLRTAPASEQHETLTGWLEVFLTWFKNEIGVVMSHDPGTRCLFILVDVALTTVIGIIKDQVLSRGFNSINQYDLCQWLTLHGASPITTSSALIRGAYNAMFAYAHGDDSQPNMEAGTSLKASILMLGIKGAPFWKMQAGMGDTIFTPIYEVLKRHGVKFKFFHKVTNLGLSADQKSIETIVIGKQVNLADGVEEYDPLVNVLNLNCWPSVPNYGQLKEGQELKDQNINLESFWTPWKDVESLTLQLGVDFDEVVLGISVAALPHICPELSAASPTWKNMVDNVQTTQTQAFQLWVDKDVNELGWKYKAGILGAYAQPMDTWAGMDQLLDKEDWPADDEPKNVSYWCGPLKDAPVIPPPTDPSFPARMKDEVRKNVEQYIDRDIRAQWPNSYDHSGFIWNNLVDLENRQGKERLNSQFWRANIDPTERYVLTVKGSSMYRIKPGESGFTNLVLAGDWTDNGFNFGCIEACAVSGIQAARKLSGKHIKIVGEEIFSHP